MARANNKAKVVKLSRVKAGKAKPKAKSKAAPKDAKVQAQVSDAILKFPASTALVQREFVDIPRRLQSEASEAAGAMGNHRKRLQQIYGADPVVPPIIDRLAKLPDGRRSFVIRQLDHLIDTLGLHNQPELPLGEPHATQEKDDSAGQGKRADNGSVPKGQPAPGLSPDEALQGFKDANEKVAAKRGDLNPDDKPGTYELQ